MGFRKLILLCIKCMFSNKIANGKYFFPLPVLPLLGEPRVSPAGKTQHPLPTGIAECCQQMAVKPCRWSPACSSIENCYRFCGLAALIQGADEN